MLDELIDPGHMLMVDDRPENFAIRPHNCVPVLPYTGEPEDTELAKLSNYLVKLTAEPGMVTANIRHFKLVQAAKGVSVQDSIDIIFESRPLRHQTSE